jgi:uncharacterized protein with HEPN domain
MRRDDNAILLDIAHAAALVAKFMTGRDKTAFLDDELTQSAARQWTTTRSGAPRRKTSRNSSCG